MQQVKDSKEFAETFGKALDGNEREFARQLARETCRRDFGSFMREFWHCVSADNLHWNWHLDEMCAALEDVARRVGAGLPKKHDLIINVPPGTTKSITVTIMFPVWCWVNWWWFRFICSSYSAALALEHAEMSREIVRSARFAELFPELTIHQHKDQKSNFRVEVSTDTGRRMGGNRYSTSVGGTVTGFHGHILISDDPLDPQGADSDKERIAANRWFDQTLSMRKINKAVTPTILVMQRLHEDDPTGHILARRKKNPVLHLCLPGEIFSEEDKARVAPAKLVQRYTDCLLDPLRMPADVLAEAEESLGQYGYASQILQSPAPPGGGMFKVDQIEIIGTPPVESRLVRQVRYWDKAGTDRKKNPDAAYTCGVKIAIERDSRKFVVLDVVRGQWSADMRERIIRSTAESDGMAVAVYVEQEPGSGGKESAEATVRNLAGYRVQPDLPRGDKTFRADPFSVQVNHGNVMLVKAPWNKSFIDELRYFPYGKYRDQVDAGSAGFNKLAHKREAKRWY